MNKRSLTIGLVFAVLAGGVTVRSVFAEDAEEVPAISFADEANLAIVAAEAEVEKAKVAIETGQELIKQIPEDSPLMPEVVQVVQAAADNWTTAVNSLKGAKESVSRVEESSTDEIGSHYALLAKVHAEVALSGANVVQISISYIDAVAGNKTESLDIIKTALQDALAASSQVQFNCGRVETLITQKYSK